MKRFLLLFLLCFASLAHATTWDSGNKSTHVTLSNGNLTATRATGAANNYAMVFSTTSKSSGLLYFEITVTHASDADTGWGMGLANVNPLLDGVGGACYIGDQPDAGAGCAGSNSVGGLERDSATSFFEVNGGGLTTDPGWQQVNNPPTGDVIGFAVDFTHNKIWVQDCTLAGGWNVGTTGTQNPATNQGGVNTAAVTNAAVFIGASLYYTASAVAAATLNTGGSAFTCTKPAGFSAWDPPAGGPPERALIGVGQ